MTGERPTDEDIVEPTDEIADGDVDATGELEPEPEPVPPMREARASQRTSGSRGKTVVPQEEAAAVAAHETAKTKAVDEKGRPVRSDEELPYIDDRVSKLWVMLIAGVFIAILVYGLLGGRGGFLSPRPTPEPSPTPVPTLTATPAASPTPRASRTPSASPSAPASATPSATPSVGPSPT